MPNGVSVPAGEIVGRVELAEGIAAPRARVVVRGTPLGTICDTDGNFSVWNVPPGYWNLRVSHPLAAAYALVAVGANSGETTNAGVIRLKATGSIRGRVVYLNPDDLATAVVAVPEQGIATQPNAGGGYLLQGVAAGFREVVLLHSLSGRAPQKKQTVLVRALQTTDGPNFIRRWPEGPTLLDFGLVIKNSSPQLVWKLSNPDAVPATLNAVAISGRDGTKFHHLLLGLPVPVGSAGVEVPVTVDTSSPGTFTADLRFQGEADGVQFTGAAALRAVVTLPPSVPLPDTRIDPTELDFGRMPAGVSTRTVEFRNDGEASDTVYIVASLAEFQVVSPAFPLLLPAHTSQTVTVRAIAPGSPGPVVGFLKFMCRPGNRALDLRVTAVW